MNRKIKQSILISLLVLSFLLAGCIGISDYTYKEWAVKDNDTNYCLKIQDETIKNECLIALNKTTHDTSQMDNYQQSNFPTETIQQEEQNQNPNPETKVSNQKNQNVEEPPLDNPNAYIKTLSRLNIKEKDFAPIYKMEIAELEEGPYFIEGIGERKSHFVQLKSNREDYPRKLNSFIIEFNSVEEAEQYYSIVADFYNKQIESVNYQSGLTWTKNISRISEKSIMLKDYSNFPNEIKFSLTFQNDIYVALVEVVTDKENEKDSWQSIVDSGGPREAKEQVVDLARRIERNIYAKTMFKLSPFTYSVRKCYYSEGKARYSHNYPSIQPVGKFVTIIINYENISGEHFVDYPHKIELIDNEENSHNRDKTSERGVQQYYYAIQTQEYNTGVEPNTNYKPSHVYESEIIFDIPKEKSAEQIHIIETNLLGNKSIRIRLKCEEIN